jgi:ribonuclease VapC
LIVLDTSALVALLLGEPEAPRLSRRIAGEDVLLMSAGTAAEALILSGQRGFRPKLEAMLADLAVEIVPLAASDVGRVADAYARWGRGNHPAGLNFGDCFAYSLAHNRQCPLLFVGRDFSRTDIEVA